MSDRGESYHCRYCGFKAKSSGGLNSHISQSPACLDKIIAANPPASHSQKQPHSPIPGSSTFESRVSDDMPIYSSLLEERPAIKRARVDPDEDDPARIKMDIVFEDFIPPAGEPRPKSAEMRSGFEQLRDEQLSKGEQPWFPFTSVEDWDYARWIMESGLSQMEINKMLKLDIVSEYIC
jgi:hypothetical protein